MRRTSAVLIGVALAAPAPVWAADAPFAPAPAPPLPAGAVPSQLAFADLDSDGHRDLVVADFYGRVLTRLGNGDGSFRAGVDLSGYNRPNALALADFDADGRDDLAVGVVAVGGGYRVVLARGAGDGSFAATQTVRLPGDVEARSLAVGDFNADGRDDLAFGTGQAVYARLGGPDFAFTGGADLVSAATQFSGPVTVADLSGDGTDDVVAPRYDNVDGSFDLILHSGQGNGRFVPGRRTPVAGVAGRAVPGDFDGDGLADLVTAIGEEDRLSVRLNRGGGSFKLPPPDVLTADEPGDPVVVDVDLDGREDLVTADRGADRLSVALGNGDGTFRDGGTVATGDAPTRLAAGDFDENGVMDVAYAIAGGTVEVRLGTTPPLTGNRLVNGSFETGTPGRTPAERPDVPVWTPSGDMTFTRYGSTPIRSVPSWADAGRWSAGRSFLAAAEASAFQDVDVSDQAAAIDAGRATMTLSALLGGTGTAPGQMTVRAEPGGVEIGPVTAAERNRRTTMLRRTAARAVPPGTRAIRVTLAATGATAMAPATADDVRLTLAAEPPPPPAPPAPTASPADTPAPTAAPSPEPTVADREAPRLTRVRIRRGRVLRFDLSEAARVEVRVTPGRALRRAGKAGGNRVVLRGLRRGRHRLTIRATDAAGNQSVTRPRRFRR